MPLSNSTNWARDRDGLITMALRKVNAIGTGEPMDADLVTETANSLNNVLKALEAEGMPLWRLTEVSITPTAGIGSYLIGENASAPLNIPAPLKVLQAYRRTTANSVTTDIPMVLKTFYDYNLIPNKSTQGTPLEVFYKTPGAVSTNPPNGQVFLWPVPNAAFVAATGTIRLLYQRPFDDVDASTDNIDVPSYWYQAIVWALADEISTDQGRPLAERAMIHKRALEERALALSFDQEEGSIMIRPDPLFLQGLR